MQMHGLTCWKSAFIKTKLSQVQRLPYGQADVKLQSVNRTAHASAGGSWEGERRLALMVTNRCMHSTKTAASQRECTNSVSLRHVLCKRAAWQEMGHAATDSPSRGVPALTAFERGCAVVAQLETPPRSTWGHGKTGAEAHLLALAVARATTSAAQTGQYKGILDYLGCHLPVPVRQNEPCSKAELCMAALLAAATGGSNSGKIP